MPDISQPPERAALRIVAYSDYICPWCYIGHARIEQLRREYDVEVVWQPFELHPETPRTGGHLIGRLGRADRVRSYMENLRELAADAGLPFAPPPFVSNSHRALEAAEFARETSGFGVYHASLFRAYFADGRDISDIDVLCTAARSCGVDDQQLRQALTEERYAGLVDRITMEARAREVLSTPTFVFSGGFRLIGGQEYSVFASVTRRLIERRAGGPQGASSIR